MFPGSLLALAAGLLLLLLPLLRLGADGGKELAVDGFVEWKPFEPPPAVCASLLSSVSIRLPCEVLLLRLPPGVLFVTRRSFL